MLVLGGARAPNHPNQTSRVRMPSISVGDHVRLCSTECNALAALGLEAPPTGSIGVVTAVDTKDALVDFDGRPGW